VLYREPLAERHDISGFSSGKDLLDSWLRQHARRAQVMGTARTYLLIDDADEPVAYYSLVPHVIRRESLPARIGHGSPDGIPAILIARLAVAASHQHRGIGSATLIDAIATAWSAITTVGGRLIVVDAIDATAEAFYRHHGFQSTGQTGRLVMKATDAARTLGLRPPPA
jgi:GNAT superfamily N-acetyltransferase